MKIIKDKLIEPFEIQINSEGYSVGIPGVDKKTGNRIVQGSKYFSRFDNCLEYISLELTKKEIPDTTDLSHFIETYREINKQLKDLF